MTPTAIECATALAIVWTRFLRLRRDNDGDHEHAEDNTYGLPDGAPISAELREWLRKQREAVLAAIPDDTIPTAFPDLTADQWTDPMAKRMTPLLGAYWSESGKEVFSRLGLDPDEWRVTNPHLEATIRGQALAFCQSTNDTTSKRIGDALRDLRAELTKGMVEEGESVRELTKRVQYVFENLSKSHATMIAATEASRAVHAAELAADVESEVVAGVELLLSSDACPLCRKIATECKRVRLGDDFAVIGSNPNYRNIKHPPIHPHCQCTMIEVLKPEYGGPLAPDWGQTLQQPQKGLGGEYVPPPHKPVPKPEPDRPKPRPTKPPPKAEPAPPPPEKAAIDRAVDFAGRKNVAVQTKGSGVIEKSFGKRQVQDIPAVFSSVDNVIRINERQRYWKDPRAAMDRSGISGSRWFSSDDIDHIIHHEVGHAKHLERAGIDRYNEVKARKFTWAEKKVIEQHVSRYGATKPIEFVAEMYAGLVSGREYNIEVSLLYLSFGGPHV